MLLERARRHYQQRGFHVLDPMPGLRADLVVEKAGARRLVRVDDDAMGAYQVGILAAEAKRVKGKATVICPSAPDLIEACEQFGVEHLTPEGLGEEGPMLARRPAVVEPAVVPTPVAMHAPVRVSQQQAIPAWRWAVVALIWVAAILAWTWLLARIF